MSPLSKGENILLGEQAASGWTIRRWLFRAVAGEQGGGSYAPTPAGQQGPSAQPRTHDSQQQEG